MSSEVGLRRCREDRDIERDVRAELETNRDIADQCLLDVTVHDGVVHLTGFAGSFAQKCAIERAVGRVVGVRDVRDYLDVRPPGGGHLEDRRIENVARCAIAWDARVPAGVEIEVTDGVVRLTGRVERFSQREAAADAVANLIGVRDLVNEIKLTPVPSPADLAARVGAAIRRRFGLESRGLWIVAVDGAVTLGGMVAKYAMIDDVERAVRSVPGVRRVDNQLLVAGPGTVDGLERGDG
jgi:osmotically-inducible protein OsmY